MRRYKIHHLWLLWFILVAMTAGMPVSLQVDTKFCHCEPRPASQHQVGTKQSLFAGSSLRPLASEEKIGREIKQIKILREGERRGAAAVSIPSTDIKADLELIHALEIPMERITKFDLERAKGIIARRLADDPALIPKAQRFVAAYYPHPEAAGKQVLLTTPYQLLASLLQEVLPDVVNVVKLAGRREFLKFMGTIVVNPEMLKTSPASIEEARKLLHHQRPVMFEEVERLMREFFRPDLHGDVLWRTWTSHIEEAKKQRQRRELVKQKGLEENQYDRKLMQMWLDDGGAPRQGRYEQFRLAQKALSGSI